MQPIFIILALVVLLVVAGAGAFLLKVKFGRTAGVPCYRAKDGLLSEAEGSFFRVLANAAHPEFVVFPKCRIADVLEPTASSKTREWRRAFNSIAMKHFDFVLCDSGTLQPVAVVELDDSSHERGRAQRRDQFVNGAVAGTSLRMLRVPCRAAYSVDELRRDVADLLRE